VAKPTLALKEKSALECNNGPRGCESRHTLNGNSLKMYDKEGSILRVHHSINCVLRTGLRVASMLKIKQMGCLFSV